MAAVWRVSLVLVCACTQAFGIRETSGPDSDGDHVMDTEDNCPLAPNADQYDRDGDALGDACDPCVDGPQSGIDGDGDGIDDACDACTSGSNHDEDLDGFLDGCDVCPGAVDDQTDTDQDGVGDACDPVPGTANTRVTFDGFAPPRASWNTGFQPWNASGEGFGPVPPILGSFAGAYLPELELPADGWSIEVAVRIDASVLSAPPDLARVRIQAVTENAGQTIRRCGVAFSSGSWHELDATDAIAVDHILRFKLQAPTSSSIECWIDGTKQVSFTTGGGLMPFWALLDANVASEFLWVDIIR
jgi:hypothetical protein